MKILYTSKFRTSYKKLPSSIKNEAEEKEKLFRKDPFDPILKTHKLTGKFKGFWSFSIDFKHRIIFELVDAQTIWFHSVGTHQIYR